MFLNFGDGQVFDFDLQFLQELVGLLDLHLTQLEEQAARVSDPDALGIYDAAQYIIGLGLVACQSYLAATYSQLRVAKREALKVGPRHRCGCTIVALVNHAANFWKHHEEWVLNANSRPQMDTLAALTTLGVGDDTDYPLSCALAALVSPAPPRLQTLLPHFEAWRHALAVAAKGRR